MTTEAIFFDTHVHLDFCAETETVVDEARRERVGKFVVPGVRREGWSGLLGLATKVEGVFAAPGLHPGAAGRWDFAVADELRRLTEEPRVVAIGEIGLDGDLDEPSMATQEQAFRGQLRLAIERGLPVLIHCRKATGRLLEILHEEDAGRVGGIFHAFSGSLETAKEAVKLGFAIGFGGPLTFPGARKAPRVLAGIPDEAIVLETDAPDLAPHPHRGEPNRPAYLTLVAEKVAEIKGWSLEETARITTENAHSVLKITDAW